MRSRTVLVGVLTVAFAGCAIVSPKTKSVESPQSRQMQMSAQKEQAIPKGKQYKRKIAIARFTNETNYGRALLTDKEFNRIGKQASDMLSSRLVSSGKFLVFERPDIEKIEREQQLLQDSKMIGVDTLIVGSVTEFGRSVKAKIGFLSQTKLQTAEAKVEVRLVDVRTGRVFFSGAGAGEATTEAGTVAGYGSRAAYDATLNDQAIGAAISDMIGELVFRLEKRPWRTYVLAIENEQIFISGGTHQGLKVGDLLNVMMSGKTVRSKQTGLELPLPSKQIAQLRLVSFFGDSELEEGSVCEIVSGELDSALINKYYVSEAQ